MLTDVSNFSDVYSCFQLLLKIILELNNSFNFKTKEVTMLLNPLVKRSGLLPSVFNNLVVPWNQILDDSTSELRNIDLPSVNIEETKDGYHISLAAPGLKKDDFKIDVDRNILTISSEKEEDKEEKDFQYTRREYNYSSFSRSFTLPEGVLYDKIDAKYEDGILQLKLPVNESFKKNLTRHIEVN